jgi:hypothetical protein
MKNTTTGIDPELAIVGCNLAHACIKRGLRDFRDFALVAKNDTGENWNTFKEHLLWLWQGAATLPEFKEFEDEIEDLTRRQAKRVISQIDKEAKKDTTINPDEIIDMVVSDIKKMPATLLSGDDSVLDTVWDEIKEQVQNEESIFWHVYLQTMRDCIAGVINAVQKSGTIEPPSYCYDEDDPSEIEDAFLELLLSRAEDEPIECEPFDFEYYCYKFSDFTIYGKVLERTGISTFQAEAYSAAAPYGEFGEVDVSKIDYILSKEEFELARQNGWPPKWITP